ncbi:MAG: nitroreductase family protein [Pseudomonadota bacterium]
MDALAALHRRRSESALGEPAPEGEVLDNIRRAALTAADHATLRPWRFLEIRGAARQRLGELFVRAREANEGELAPAERERTRNRPLRAPLLIVVIASCRTTAKVPEIEQLISAGAAAQNMLNAAYVQGVGAIWRTGDFAYDATVRAGLGLEPRERILGFLYLGTVIEPRPPRPELNPADFFRDWPAPDSAAGAG